MRSTSILALALAGLLLSPALGQRLPREDVVDVPARAEGLCVSNLFQSHMVLQRQRPIALWGWAAPGEQVQVQLVRTSPVRRPMPRARGGSSCPLARPRRHPRW